MPSQDPFSGFLTYLRNELNRAQLTADAYGRDLAQFSNWLTCFNPAQFRPESVILSDIRAWLASLGRQKVTPRSLRRKAQSLRAYFRFLQKRGIIKSNPAADLILPKLARPLPDHVREDEMEALLHEEEEETRIRGEEGDEGAEEAMRSALIVEMLYSLGLRRAELIALSDPDISHSASEIKVTGKRSKQRVVPVPEALMAHIRRWQELRDKLFPDLPTPRPLFAAHGKRITASQVYYTVKKALGSSSARRKSPHALRHSFATAMLNEGADISSVKEFLGHASLATTQIYTHVSFADIKKAYNGAHPRTKNQKKE